MQVHVVKSDDGETVERSDLEIFEGGQVWGRPLSAGLSGHTNVSVVNSTLRARADWHTRPGALRGLRHRQGGRPRGHAGNQRGRLRGGARKTRSLARRARHRVAMTHLSIMPVGTETTVLDG